MGANSPLKNWFATLSLVIGLTVSFICGWVGYRLNKSTSGAGTYFISDWGVKSVLKISVGYY